MQVAQVNKTAARMWRWNKKSTRVFRLLEAKESRKRAHSGCDPRQLV